MAKNKISPKNNPAKRVSKGVAKIGPKSKATMPKKIKETKKEEGIHRVKIRVIGIGGGGGTIVNELAKTVPRADFWIANTDLQALKRVTKHCHTFSFGQELTKGLGTGADPKIGYLAAKQASEKIVKLFQGIDLCILVSCLGGGTGSGAAPVFAQLAREIGCLTLGIFTLPFHFEGERKLAVAKQSLVKMLPELSASVIFPNEKIFKIIDPKVGFQASLSAVNSMLAEDLKNLIEVIWLPGLINIDFADLKTILGERGQLAYLASATVNIENRAKSVCEQLLAHPLSEYNPRGAKNILFNISFGKNLSIDEVNYISKSVFDLNPQARIIFGVSQNSGLDKGITVTLLAVGARDESRTFPLHGKVRDKKKREARKEVKKHEATKDKSRTFPQGKALGKKKTLALRGAPHKEGGRPESLLAPKIETKTTVTKKKSSLSPRKRTLRPKKQKIKQKPPSLIRRVLMETKTEPLKSADILGSKTIKEKLNLPGKRYKELQRKSALDIRREMESSEQEQVAQERKWDIPAFLRRGQI